LQRQVRGQALVSESEPAVTITFDAAYEYVGGQRWDLLGIADAEQHLFVKPGKGRAVEALYWVQFERFLPTNEHTYGYAADWVADIGGLEFICDTQAYADYAELNRDPESDGDYAQSLLERHGYKFPKAAGRLRAIHLPTPDRRSELMIIYAETQEPGHLREDGLLERAVSGMKVTRS
jgi:hypothetical protein